MTKEPLTLIYVEFNYPAGQFDTSVDIDMGILNYILVSCIYDLALPEALQSLKNYVGRLAALLTSRFPHVISKTIYLNPKIKD